MAKLGVKIIILLTFLAGAAAATSGTVITISGATATTTTIPPAGRHRQQAAAISGRRSRFLLGNTPAYFACSSKKNSAGAGVCLAPGSPGPTCCGGQCVDTMASGDHCGGCNKLCRHDRSTCCSGRCVDLLSDHGNCGACGHRCNKRCNNGFCDYAL